MRGHSLAAMAAIVLFASSVLAQPEPSIPSLSNDQVNRLNNGEVIVNMNSEGTPIGEAIGVVDAPPEQVYAVVADFNHQSDWLEDMSSSEVVGEEGEFTLTRGVTDTPWPMNDREWTTRTWNGQREVDGVPAWLSMWTYVEGSGNMQDTQGYWLFIPWGDDGSKTLVRYWMLFDLGSDMPDFLLNWATESLLPTRIQALRGQVR